MAPVEKDPARGLNGALAAEIRAQQGARNIKTSALSELSGIERVTLTRYLKPTRPINTAVVEAIARALDMDPGELMARAIRRRDEEPALYAPMSEEPPSLRAVAKKGRREEPGEDSI